MNFICAEVGQEIYAPNANGVFVFPDSAIGQTVKFTAQLDAPIVKGELDEGFDFVPCKELPPQQTDPVWNGAV